MTFDLIDLARKGLQSELTRLDSERARIQELLARLGSRSKDAQSAVSETGPRTRKMSPEGRQRIQEAVRRRWDRVRAEQEGLAGKEAVPAVSAQARALNPLEVRAPRKRATSERSGGRKK